MAHICPCHYCNICTQVIIVCTILSTIFLFMCICVKFVSHPNSIFQELFTCTCIMHLLVYGLIMTSNPDLPEGTVNGDEEWVGGSGGPWGYDAQQYNLCSVTGKRKPHVVTMMRAGTTKATP